MTACQPVLLRIFAGHFAIAALFTTAAVSAGRPLGFWETLPVVLAATWTSTSGMALLLEFDKALKERRFFVERAVRVLAPAFIVSELVSFSILSFWVEMVTLPVIIFLGLMVQVAGEKEEYHKVVQFANTLLVMYVFALVSLTITSLVDGSEDWQSIVQHLALPVWLTLGALFHLHLLVLFERVRFTFRSKSQNVTARQYGSAWPLTVSSAKLCYAMGAVWVEVKGKKYWINGLSEAILRRNGFTCYDLHEIWKDDPDREGSKVNISPLFNAGRALEQS